MLPMLDAIVNESRSVRLVTTPVPDALPSTVVLVAPLPKAVIDVLFGSVAVTACEALRLAWMATLDVLLAVPARPSMFTVSNSVRSDRLLGIRPVAASTGQPCRKNPAEFLRLPFSSLVNDPARV